MKQRREAPEPRFSGKLYSSKASVSFFRKRLAMSMCPCASLLGHKDIDGRTRSDENVKRDQTDVALSLGAERCNLSCD